MSAPTSGTGVGRAAVIAAMVAGAAAWSLAASATHRVEAWDSPVYFSFVMPAMAIVAAVLGFVVPVRVWRWAFLPFAGQALVAFARNPTANLMPLGLIVFAIFGAMCLVPAYLGAWLRRRISP